MSLEIFKLVGSIMVDGDQADKSLQKTDKNAKGVGETLASGVKNAAKWGTAIVGGATGAVGAVTKLAKSSSSTADNIDKMSQKIGISAKSYQEWDYILSQNGMDVDKLQVGIKTMTNQMNSAANGSKASADAFKQLGVEVTNSDGSLRKQEDVFNEAIGKLQGMQNETERSALATKLFGKAGSEMAPLLNQSAESTDELRKKCNELGMVLSDDTIKSGVSLNDTLDTMERSFSAVKTNLGAAFMPIVEKAAKFIIGKMPQISEMFKKLEPVLTAMMDKLLPPLMDMAGDMLPVIFDMVSQIIPPLSDIASEILPIFTDIISELMPFLIEVVKAVLPVALNLLKAIMPIIKTLTPILQPILDLIMKLLQPLLNLINFIMPPIINLIGKVVQTVTNILKPVIQWLADFLGNKLNNAVNGLKTTVNNVKTAFVNAWNGIKTAWSNAVNWFGKIGDGIKNVFSTAANFVKNVFKTPINWIIDQLNKFIRGINKIKIPDWVPGVGGNGFHIGEIPKLAKGGVVEESTVANIGERGAEAIVPLEKNKEWISAVSKELDSVGGKETVSLLEDILDKLDAVLKMGIVLDTGKLVGGIANDMDMALGSISVRRARG